MLEPDLIELFVRPLERLQFRYVISGSVAAMLYGEPRVTHDIDFVVFLRPVDISRLPEAYPSPEFYLPPGDVIAEEVMRKEKGQFNIINPASGLKADFYITNRDELDAWAFRNARKYAFENIVVRLAPPEYVILRKLEFYREGGLEKHLRDIRAMLAVSGEIIDKAELNRWIEQRQLQSEWKKVG
ncbi:MAG TPA: hypothetical protein VGY56_10300 [Verrucomicrobiae bacterium]|nr:hypothetical protein [Verrucomicrobiae bacterium]